MRITRSDLKRLVENYLSEQEEADEETTDTAEEEDAAAEEEEEGDAEEGAEEEEEVAPATVPDMKPFPFPIQGTKFKGVVGIESGRPVARVEDPEKLGEDKTILDLNAMNTKNPKKAKELSLGLFKQAVDTLKNQEKVTLISNFFEKVAKVKKDSKDLARYKKDLNIEISKLRDTYD